MAQTTWEKASGIEGVAGGKRRLVNWRFIIAGLVILGAVGYLIIAGTLGGMQYFITVEDLLKNKTYIGQTVRISGAVIGETINYDSERLIMEFTVSNIAPQANDDDLAQALYESVLNPKAARVKVRIENQVKPDLLKNEAQAIMTGKLGADGVFRATDLMLKCPSRFQESDPNKAIASPGK
jgi:cytochrome c-type biogenesis protein CcmE